MNAQRNIPRPRRLLTPLVALVFGAALAAPAQRSPAYVEAAFTPDCKDLLLRELRAAKTSVDVAIFVITDDDVAEALIAARRSGTTVRVKYASENETRYEQMQDTIAALRERGVECIAIDLKGTYKKMHHKFVVIDGRKVLTGSYNFSVTAGRDSFENFVMIESRSIARQFAEAFEAIRSDE